MIAFQGPLTGEVLESLLEDGALPEPRRNACSRVTVAGADILLARTGYTGEPICFELMVPAAKAEAVWSALAEAGAPRGIVPCGLGSRDTLRLEAFLPLYGHELGTDPEGNEFPAYSFPLTGMAVSFSERKGDFIGRAALHRQFEVDQLLKTGDYHGSTVLPRRTRGLALLAPGVARQGHEVFVGERKVGFVTSGTAAPYWKFAGQGATMHLADEHDRRSIALACLDASLLPGAEVEVDVRGRRLPCRVVAFHGRSEAPPYFRAAPVVPAAAALERHADGGPGRAREVLARALANHEWRQGDCINLIPSEMTPSPLVRLLQVSDPVGRYAEHRELLALGQEVFYYQGTDFIEWVEAEIAAEMSAYLGCRRIESRLVSGQMANMTVFSAIVDWRNRVDRRREPQRIRLVMNNHIGKGGHLSSQPMGALRDYIARDPATERPAVVNFPVEADNPYRIDVAATGHLLERLNPEVIIFGKSMVLHPEPVAEIRAMVEGREDRPLIMYDMAHVLGLVGPHFQEPFRDGADIVTGSTHKTFFGTQRGIVAADFAEGTPEFDLWKAVRRRAFPGMLSNHHLGTHGRPAAGRHRDEHLQGRVPAAGDRQRQGLRPGPGGGGPGRGGRPGGGLHRNPPGDRQGGPRPGRRGGPHPGGAQHHLQLPGHPQRRGLHRLVGAAPGRVRDDPLRHGGTGLPGTGPLVRRRGAGRGGGGAGGGLPPPVPHHEVLLHRGRLRRGAAEAAADLLDEGRYRLIR